MSELGLSDGELDPPAPRANHYWRLLRIGAGLFSQILSPVAVVWYLVDQSMPYAMLGAFAASVFAMVAGAYAARALRDAGFSIQVISAALAVIATGACLCLYAFFPLRDASAATALCALALISANLIPALTLLAPQTNKEQQTAPPAIGAATLPLPAAMVCGEVAAITTVFLFAPPHSPLALPMFFAALVGVAALFLLAIQRTETDEKNAAAFCDSATQFLIVIAFMVLLAFLSVLSGVAEPLLSRGSDAPEKVALLLVACGIAVLGPVLICWRQAVEDQRFPAPKRSHAPFDHIDAWAVIFFAAAITVILLIAMWATTSQATSDGINANWGLWTTGIVAALFVAFAFAPHIELSREMIDRLARTSSSVGWLGRAVSWLDAVMAVPIACAIGANLERVWARYLILSLAIVPCGVLAYWLPAPYGLLAIAWGFVATIAVSRRWAWVEDDRELAMLTRNFSSSSLRVGFKQDLRDEALLSFMSMFIFVPLTLRQADMWAVANGVELFTLTDDAPNDLRTWVAFYGSELAKAVPFVDWAETYSVEGKTNVEFKDSIWAKHLVFLTRILVDLVFLGALLQAMAISARISNQREMFFGKERYAAKFRHGNREKLRGELDRLDPFIEAKELRKLMGPSDAIDREKLEQFPTYDAARLIALKEGKDKTLARVASELRDYQRSNDPKRLEEMYEVLLTAVSERGRIDKERVVELVNALKQESFGHNVVVLRAARGGLNGKVWSNSVRQDLMHLIVGAKEGQVQNERLEALIWCLTGDRSGEPAENPEERVRDVRGDVREIAFAALTLMHNNQDAHAAIQNCAESDPAEYLKRRARAFLEKYPRPSLGQ